jgi:hypothetical protein
MAAQLKEWEDGLPLEHRWNPDLVPKYKAQCEDLVRIVVVSISQELNFLLIITRLM